MRHYEIVFLVNPDQSDQVPAMLKKYSGVVADSGGKIHREENWGRKQLAYPINKIYKAHYILLNIECSKETMQELSSSFKFNDTVIRHMILQRKTAITEKSAILMNEENNKSENYKKNDAMSEHEEMKNVEDSINTNIAI